jgi:hypothetical protein
VAYLLREYLPENIAQHLLKNEPSLKKMWVIQRFLNIHRNIH